MSQDAKQKQLLQELEKLEEEQKEGAGKLGANRRSEILEQANEQKRKRLQQRLDLLVKRSAEAELLNGSLINSIDELRAARKDHLARIRATEARERAMMQAR